MFHHVRPEPLFRHAHGFALEQHVLEPPALGRQRAGITHLALQRKECVPHRPAGGVARRPALARTRVRRVPVGAQRAAVDPRVGHGVEDVLPRPAEQPGGHRCGRDPHEQHVVQPDAVETVFQRQHALDFVRLDHGQQHVFKRQRLAALAHGLARKKIRHGEDGPEVIGRMPPFRREPGVVEIQPPHRRADVERRLHGVQFERRARHARADAGHGRAGHDGAEHLRTGRVRQREQPAAEGIEQTIPRRVERFRAARRTGNVERVVGDPLEQVVEGRAGGVGEIVGTQRIGERGRSESSAGDSGGFSNDTCP